MKDLYEQIENYMILADAAEMVEDFKAAEKH